MHPAKENLEISIVGRLLSLEALLLVMGLVSLGYGVATLRLWNIIIGAAILCAAFFLARKARRDTPKGRRTKGEES